MTEVHVQPPDVEVTPGYVCQGDGQFYLGPRCHAGHEHVLAERTVTTTYTVRALVPFTEDGSEEA